MSKVICPCIECVHNNDTVCNSNKIELTFRNMTTVNEDRVNMWICKQYELSNYAKKIEEEIANTIGLQTESED